MFRRSGFTRLLDSLIFSEEPIGRKGDWVRKTVGIMMKWSVLRRRGWIVLVILDTCAILTTLSGIGFLLSLKPENLYGLVFVATGVGFLWYVSRPILKGKSPEKST